MAIRNLRPIIGADVVLADGARFDYVKVLEASFGFVEAFAAALRVADPSVELRYRIVGTGLDPLPYDEAAKTRVRGAFADWAKDYDACGASCNMTIGAYRLTLDPLGGESLYWNGERRVYEQNGEGPWEEFDPTPLLKVTPADSTSPFLGLERRLFVTEFFEDLAPPGTAFKRDQRDGLAADPPALRFGHATYGAGLGPIRIRLIRTPRIM
jgi:hypothetical protein